MSEIGKPEEPIPSHRKTGPDIVGGQVYSEPLSVEELREGEQIDEEE
jgi:hypothetical protein